MSKIDEGFVKAGSDNLPMVDSVMVQDYFANNVNFVSAEIRNVKTQRSAKETYGDKAISYVQLKRNGDICTVKAKITPEHKIRQKPYSVVALINEKDEQVVSTECLDCPASQGGCKHGVAFLLWLHRRSEEPSVTSTVCYWKSSSLSRVSNTDMRISSILGEKIITLDSPNSSIICKVVDQFPCNDGSLFRLYQEGKYPVSIHQLSLKYKEFSSSRSEGDFIQFMSDNMTDEECRQAEINTRGQAASQEWHELRYGRITASVFYESARCKTEGSLVEKILGASPPLQTEAIHRGKTLEKNVLEEVSRLWNIHINEAGLFLNRNHPIFGASPDGISDIYVVEVKCPFKEKTVEKYISNGVIQKKFSFQIQLQMFFCGKKKGLFCVASPKFEEDRNVQIVEVELDEEKLFDMMDHAKMFWGAKIYPHIIY